MKKDLEALRQQIHEFKMGRFEEKIFSLAKPTIQMLPQQTNDEDIPIGASKLGGNPDLPPDFEWFMYQDVPLTFLAQFNLSEIAQYDREEILPKHGMLYFFYEIYAMEWVVFAHDKKDAWKLFYIEDENTELVRHAHPKLEMKDSKKIEALPTHQLKFERKLALPLIEDEEHAKDFGLDFVKRPNRDGDIDRYQWNILEPHFISDPHFLGYPDFMQKHLMKEVVANSEQINTHYGKKSYQDYWTDEEFNYIKSQEKNWQFLFQIGSMENFELVGKNILFLYICIPKASLKGLKFQDCWLIPYRITVF